MARPLNDSPYLYGIHDPGGEHLMAEGGARGWILFTEELGSDPNDTRGADYSRWANDGYGTIVRLNHGYEPNGTIPNSGRYADFSRRVAAFVKASKGCHIWIIGNETNFAVERPGVVLDRGSNPPRIVASGEVITPELYARCYTLCRNAIRRLPGHTTDQVITAAVAPWNAQTTYAGNPTGDWVQYQADILAELGPSGCDGISIHSYTHGADPSLVHTNTTMNPPFANRQYNFRAYQDFMRAIPAGMRHLPVYLTETDQNDAWQNVNRGWIQRVYGEIDWWNRQPETQVIRAVILYRWPNVDRWGLESKTALHDDFRQALVHKYNWEAAMQAKPQVQPKPSDDGAVKQPAITDITGQLSRDPSKMVARTKADIRYVVINHTAVRPEIGADRVATAQRQRWPGILSQYYITGDGKIQRTNPDEEVVSRDQAWIFNGLNIYVAGNFDAAAPIARPTHGARQSLRLVAGPVQPESGCAARRQRLYRNAFPGPAVGPGRQMEGDAAAHDRRCSRIAYRAARRHHRTTARPGATTRSDGRGSDRPGQQADRRQGHACRPGPDAAGAERRAPAAGQEPGRCEHRAEDAARRVRGGPAGAAEKGGGPGSADRRIDAEAAPRRAADPRHRRHPAQARNQSVRHTRR